MSIDEQELRRRLAETAAQASPPGFTAGSLVRRIRRRRARILAAVSAAFLAAAAIAIAIPVSLSSASRQPANPPALIPQLSFTVMVNGQPGARGTVPRFVIVPGEDITINVSVTVPAHTTVEGLWVGIASGAFGASQDGPSGVSPTLAARTRTPLAPGVRRFLLHWVVPAGLPHGTSRLLVGSWAIREGAATRAIAAFVVQ